MVYIPLKLRFFCVLYKIIYSFCTASVHTVQCRSFCIFLLENVENGSRGWWWMDGSILYKIPILNALWLYMQWHNGNTPTYVQLAEKKDLKPPSFFVHTLN